MDSPSEAADEEPAAASISADSTLRGKNTRMRRSCVIPEPPRVRLLHRCHQIKDKDSVVAQKEKFE